MYNYELIIQRAWEDQGFKSRLISNPKAVFAQMGEHIREEITIEIHDDSMDTTHFVLLDQVQARALQLDTPSQMGRIVQRAYEDPEYKARLLRDAKAAVKEVIDFDIPANIIVHANTSNHIHLVLPINPNSLGAFFVPLTWPVVDRK
ncbi:nitrile hydratase subunit alpha [Deltaproteobacteria bacterium TL4]